MGIKRETPIFNHPEVQVLYQYDLAIPQSIVETLFMLPRETLIEDLGTMLKDATVNFKYYIEKGWDEETMEFPLHAFWMLADLKEEHSLNYIFEFLRQDEDFLHFWFGDSLTEDLWEVLYQIGSNSLEQLKAFVLEPDLYSYAKTVASSAVTQIALHHPERRMEVVEWYRSIFDIYLNMEEDNLSMDLEFISSMAGDALSFRGQELLPQIEKLYQKNLIYIDFIGTYESVVEDMGKYPATYYRHSVYENIFERYKAAVSTWHYYQMKYNEDYRKRHTYPKTKPITNHTFFSAPSKQSTYERQGKKIGRNDPCPCGSGKKYKKCCGRKG